MSKKRTQEEFEELVISIHSGNIVVISEYMGKAKKAMFKCLKCNGVWETTAGNVVAKKNPTGCPKCYGHERFTIDDFMTRFKEIHGDSIILNGIFEGLEAKAKFKCAMCNYEWETIPSNLIKSRPTRCKVCQNKKNGIKQRLSQDEFAEKLFTKHNGEIISLDKFETVSDKMRFKHNIPECGHVWGVSVTNVLHNGSGCPICSGSKGEKFIRNLLQKQGTEFREQYRIKDCKDKRCLPFDFAVFLNGNLNLLIEYDGKQHYLPQCQFGKKISSFETIQRHDQIKNAYCTINNIPLLRIPYWYTHDEICSAINQQLSLIISSNDIVEVIS